MRPLKIVLELVALFLFRCHRYERTTKSIKRVAPLRGIFLDRMHGFDITSVGSKKGKPVLTVDSLTYGPSGPINC